MVSIVIVIIIIVIAAIVDVLVVVVGVVIYIFNRICYFLAISLCKGQPLVCVAASGKLVNTVNHVLRHG